MQESEESLGNEDEKPYGSYELVLARFAEDISWQAPCQMDVYKHNASSGFPEHPSKPINALNTQQLSDCISKY